MEGGLTSGTSGYWHPYRHKGGPGAPWDARQQLNAASNRGVEGAKNQPRIEWFGWMLKIATGGLGARGRMQEGNGEAL